MARQIGRAGTRRQGGRDPELDRVWRGRVREQARGKLSVRDFCELHELPESAFYYWRREIARRDATSRIRVTRARETIQHSRFLPVAMAADDQDSAVPSESLRKSAAAFLELVHPGGVIVRVPAVCDAAMLAMVLDVLERRSC